MRSNRTTHSCVPLSPSSGKVSIPATMNITEGIASPRVNAGRRR